MVQILETIKRTAERLTGMGRPPHGELSSWVRDRKANAFRFRDDGIIPNHPRWPLIIYRGCLKVPDTYDPAAAFEDLFEKNGWGDSWRDGIYDYAHYHSRIHEVLGIARGSGKVRFGGGRGRTLHLKAGDVAILPAGTGHQSLTASDDFLVVGAYPPVGTYDECTTEEDRKKAIPAIARTGRPRKDPVYGSNGPLVEAWKNKKSNGGH
ncbi:cupin [Roseiarcaceae bacterium H3SJ34-1]|uniref:cupin n=1 Tax=Terripilifer ovatus TaxID=3032367 RepID=UPI003AB9BBED|nr:cupin [Roseiarcaceae bacterium H3SJ34-1]